MREEKDGGKFVIGWLLALSPAIWVPLASGCGSAPHDAALAVPLGSKVTELDHYFRRGRSSQGEVTEWSKPASSGPNATGMIRNGFGTFEKGWKGSYDDWKASPQERDRFTGEILFYDHGSSSDDVNQLIYVDGKLVNRDWGYLPG